MNRLLQADYPVIIYLKKYYTESYHENGRKNTKIFKENDRPNSDRL